MMWFLLAGVALGDGLPPRPDVPASVAGQCSKVYPLRGGQPFPPSLLASPRVSPTCSGVVVPLSDYADLLAVEKWATAIEAQYAVDTKALEMDRDWYKTKLEKELEPKPWLERPGTQRWLGRLETLVTVGVVAVGLSAAYQYGSGGFK